MPGHAPNEMADSPGIPSMRPTEVSETLPLLRTTNVKVATSPAAGFAASSSAADFVSSMDAPDGSTTVAFASSSTTIPRGEEPTTDAVFTTEPASTSSWVSV